MTENGVFCVKIVWFVRQNKLLMLPHDGYLGLHPEEIYRYFVNKFASSRVFFKCFTHAPNTASVCKSWNSVFISFIQSNILGYMSEIVRTTEPTLGFFYSFELVFHWILKWQRKIKNLTVFEKVGQCQPVSSCHVYLTFSWNWLKDGCIICYSLGFRTLTDTVGWHC